MDLVNAIAGMPAADVEFSVLNIIAEWICKDIIVLQEAETL